MHGLNSVHNRYLATQLATDTDKNVVKGCLVLVSSGYKSTDGYWKVTAVYIDGHGYLSFDGYRVVNAHGVIVKSSAKKNPKLTRGIRVSGVVSVTHDVSDLHRVKVIEAERLDEKYKFLEDALDR